MLDLQLIADPDISRVQAYVKRGRHTTAETFELWRYCSVKLIAAQDRANGWVESWGCSLQQHGAELSMEKLERLCTAVVETLENLADELRCLLLIHSSATHAPPLSISHYQRGHPCDGDPGAEG